MIKIKFCKHRCRCTVTNALQQICHPNIQSVSIPSAYDNQWLRIGKEGKRKVFGPSTRARKVKVSAPAPSIPNSNSSWTLNCGTLCPILSYPILSLYFSRTQFRGTQSTRGSILAFVYIHRRILAGSVRGRKDNRWQRGQRDRREREKEGGRRRKREREREKATRGDPLLSNSGCRRCRFYPSTLCTWINSINPFHRIKGGGVGGLREKGAKRGGNSNNPEVFSRSPPGQRGSQDTAKTVRVLCSIHPIAHTPFSFSFFLYPSIGICFYLLVSSSSSPYPPPPFVQRIVVVYSHTKLRSPARLSTSPSPPLLCLLNSCVGCT